MSGPRNRLAWERGHALRSRIRTILLAHPPTATPLSGKQVLRQLNQLPEPKLRTVQWHMAMIHAEHDTPQSAQFITAAP